MLIQFLSRVVLRADLGARRGDVIAPAEVYGVARVALLVAGVEHQPRHGDPVRSGQVPVRIGLAGRRGNKELKLLTLPMTTAPTQLMSPRFVDTPASEGASKMFMPFCHCNSTCIFSLS